MRRIISLAAKIWGILQLQQLLMLKECVHGEQQDIALQPRSQRQQQLHHRVLRRNKQGLPAIVVGRLGHVKRMTANTSSANDNGNDDEYDYNNDEAFRSSLEIEVLQILHEQFESLGAEELRITGRIRQNKKNGSLHVRLQELIHGRPVDGTSLAVHLSLNGTIYAMNGEHVNGRRSKASSTMMIMTTTTTNSTTPAIDGKTACVLAILAANISLSDVVQRTTLSNTSPELTNVMDFEGKACLAWKCHVEYHATNFIGQRTFRRDILYGDAQDGSLCAIHPQVYGLSGGSGGGGGGDSSGSGNSTTNTAGGAGARVHTFTCIPANAAAPDPFLKTCTLYSNSTQVIRTGHNSLDCAHNYALATFKYYQDNHGLWSIDGNGMAMTSYVLNEAFNFDNAFWSGGSMTYGDGDQWFLPMSLDAGVVGHEFTHGVTEYSSGLIYYGESGALNEAMSDVFGVLIDRQEGARGHDIWILGDKISQSGDGLRDMSDPASMGHFDYYPTRYLGTDDYGGVHWNSGIANLAFKLLITGGTHPRGKSSVVVPGLIDLLGDEDFAFKTAGDIFFCANDECLTPSSTFADARHCTATICGSTGLPEDSAIVHSIHTAWFAVGVGDDPPTHMPTARPTIEPSSAPTPMPSSLPTSVPTLRPSIAPSSQPTSEPSSRPSFSPSSFPSNSPSSNPTMVPSSFPSSSPSSIPSVVPSPFPTATPTLTPSDSPSSHPSQTPTSTPSHGPTSAPSSSPSKVPSDSPTSTPSAAPSVAPSSSPSAIPSNAPSNVLSDMPSSSPSLASVQPSDSPSDMPSSYPSMTSVQPSDAPSSSPSDMPAGSPSLAPSNILSGVLLSGPPSKEPSESKSLSETPSATSSVNATPSRMPIPAPSAIPNEPMKITSTPTTIVFYESEPTLAPSTLSASFVHAIRKSTMAKISVNSSSSNPSPVEDQAAMSSSIPSEDATLPPIDPNILPEPCPGGNSACLNENTALNVTATLALNVPSMSPTLGSSRLTANRGENGSSNEYSHETASASARQDASEKDAYHVNAADDEHANESVPGEEKRSKITMAVGNLPGGLHNSSIYEETIPREGSQQSSTLDSTRASDNVKIWKLVVVSMAMGALVLIVAVTGLVLYRTLKNESNEQYFKYDAAAPLV